MDGRSVLGLVDLEGVMLLGVCLSGSQESVRADTISVWSAFCKAFGR